jgi:hypothetical protein
MHVQRRVTLMRYYICWDQILITLFCRYEHPSEHILSPMPCTTACGLESLTNINCICRHNLKGSSAYRMIGRHDTDEPDQDET